MRMMSENELDKRWLGCEVEGREGVSWEKWEEVTETGKDTFHPHVPHRFILPVIQGRWLI